MVPSCKSLPRSERSNRTFMELKYISDGKANIPEISSNRTFMELKYASRISGKDMEMF